jgi:hypothetical protein
MFNAYVQRFDVTKNLKFVRSSKQNLISKNSYDIHETSTWHKTFHPPSHGSCSGLCPRADCSCLSSATATVRRYHGKWVRDCVPAHWCSAGQKRHDVMGHVQYCRRLVEGRYVAWRRTTADERLYSILEIWNLKLWVLTILDSDGVKLLNLTQYIESIYYSRINILEILSRLDP